MKASQIIMSMVFALSSSLAFAQQAGETAAAPAAPAAKKVYKSPLLDRAQIDALLAKPDQLVIVDLRRPDELITKGGFPVYLSIQSKELEKNAAFIPKDRTVVTVSNHAGRALPAADLLLGKGFKVAGAIGVEGYESEGGTLVRLTPPPPRQPAAAPAPENK